jgi:hypothetical protein
MKIAISLLTICIIFSLQIFAKDGDKKCTSKYENRTLYVGEKGGCYYITIKDKKRVKNYIDRSFCKGCN